MGSNPSYFQGDKGGGPEYPVEQVSWNDVEEFLTKLNAYLNEDAWLYRLPTDWEWEYACRGGATSKKDSSFDFYFLDPQTNQPVRTMDLSSDQANFDGN